MVEYRVYPDPKYPDNYGIFRHDDSNNIILMAQRKNYDEAVNKANDFLAGEIIFIINYFLDKISGDNNNVVF